VVPFHESWIASESTISLPIGSERSVPAKYRNSASSHVASPLPRALAWSVTRQRISTSPRGPSTYSGGSISATCTVTTIELPGPVPSPHATRRRARRGNVRIRVTIGAGVVLPANLFA
jgi:hypothetical protein